MRFSKQSTRSYTYAENCNAALLENKQALVGKANTQSNECSFCRDTKHDAFKPHSLICSKLSHYQAKVSDCLTLRSVWKVARYEEASLRFRLANASLRPRLNVPSISVSANDQRRADSFLITAAVWEVRGYSVYKRHQHYCTSGNYS